MFLNCDDLLSMIDDAKVNKEQVKVKSKYGLSISKKEEKKSFKIVIINRMFYGCKSLIFSKNSHNLNILKLYSI